MRTKSENSLECIGLGIQTLKATVFQAISTKYGLAPTEKCISDGHQQRLTAAVPEMSWRMDEN